MHSSSASSSSKATLALGALFLVLNALTAQAFHVEYGTDCLTVGAACSYISDDSSTGGSKSTVVSGFCAPDLHCASQGAKCSSDDMCFNYCGTDNTCGGAGAGCNTQDTFLPGQPGIACHDDKFRCTATNGEVGQCRPKADVQLLSSPTTTTNDSDVVSANAAADADDAIVLAPSQNNARRSKRRLDTAAYHQHQVRSSDLRKAFARRVQDATRKLL